MAMQNAQASTKFWSLLYIKRMDKNIQTNIEHTLATQDQQIQDLSDMVNAQWKEIDRLKQRLTKTTHKIQMLEESMDTEDTLASERPPHY